MCTVNELLSFVIHMNSVMPQPDFFACKCNNDMHNLESNLDRCCSNYYHDDHLKGKFNIQLKKLHVVSKWHKIKERTSEIIKEAIASK